MSGESTRDGAGCCGKPAAALSDGGRSGDVEGVNDSFHGVQGLQRGSLAKIFATASAWSTFWLSSEVS